MKEFWNTIQLVFAAVGGWLGYFLGGCDGLLIALVIFVTCDYLTGIICAIYKDAVFDTNRKSLLRHISAEKGLK